MNQPQWFLLFCLQTPYLKYAKATQNVSVYQVLAFLTSGIMSGESYPPLGGYFQFSFWRLISNPKYPSVPNFSLIGPLEPCQGEATLHWGVILYLAMEVNKQPKMYK